MKSTAFSGRCQRCNVAVSWPDAGGRFTIERSGNPGQERQGGGNGGAENGSSVNRALISPMLSADVRRASRTRFWRRTPP